MGNKELKKYFIDFEGYCAIDARSPDEAKNEFWNGLQSPTKGGYDAEYEVVGWGCDSEEDNEDEFSIMFEEYYYTELEKMLEPFFPDTYGKYIGVPNPFNALCTWKPTAWKKLKARMFLMEYIGPYRTI